MTSTEYGQLCIDADKELAELLGYYFQDYQCDGNYKWYDRQHNECTFPRWTQSDAEAFRLAVEHELDILWFFDSIRAENNLGTGHSDQEFKDFPDKFSAARFAIVQAVINKLKVK